MSPHHPVGPPPGIRTLHAAIGMRQLCWMRRTDFFTLTARAERSYPIQLSFREHSTPFRLPATWHALLRSFMAV